MNTSQLKKITCLKYIKIIKMFFFNMSLLYNWILPKQTRNINTINRDQNTVCIQPRFGYSVLFLNYCLVPNIVTQILKTPYVSKSKHSEWLLDCAGIVTALTWPASLLAAASVIDNPWCVCLSRSAEVGKHLAQVLRSRQQVWPHSVLKRILKACRKYKWETPVCLWRESVPSV